MLNKDKLWKCLLQKKPRWEIGNVIFLLPYLNNLKRLIFLKGKGNLTIQLSWTGIIVQKTWTILAALTKVLRVLGEMDNLMIYSLTNLILLTKDKKEICSYIVTELKLLYSETKNIRNQQEWLKYYHIVYKVMTRLLWYIQPDKTHPLVDSNLVKMIGSSIRISNINCPAIVKQKWIP